MDEPLRSAHDAAGAEKRRLDSWKAIANYLGRTVRTVQRWEKQESLPVHRHLHNSQGTVYAYVDELADWRADRSAMAEQSPGRQSNRRRIWAASIAVLAGVALSYSSKIEPDGLDGDAAQSWTMLISEWVAHAEALSYRPDADAEQYFAIGWEHLRRRNYAEAIRAFESAILQDPRYARPYGGIAMIHALQSTRIMNRVSYARARETAVRALEIDPVLVEAHTALGIIALDELGAEQAELTLRGALEIDAEFADAHFWLSIALREQGRHTDADLALEQALRIDPLHPLIIEEQGARHWALGDYAAARQVFSRMLDSPAPPTEAFNSLQLLSRDFGRYEEAVYWARQTARNGPLFWGFGALIDIYTRLEMTRDAERWIAHLRLAEADSPPRLGIWCKYLYMNGRHEECYELKEAYLASSGHSLGDLPFAIRETMGGMAVVTGRYDEGIAILEPLFGTDFRIPEQLGGSDMALGYAQILVYAYQQVGRDEEATAVLRKIRDHVQALRESGGRWPNLHVVEARSHLLSGETRLALDSLRRAVNAGWREYVYERPNPIWTPLQDSTEYQDLLTRVKADMALQRERIESAGRDLELEAVMLNAIRRNAARDVPDA